MRLAIVRAPRARCKLKDIFPGIWKIRALERVLGRHHADIIENTRVFLDSERSFMWISRKREVGINPAYLRRARPEQLYLDLVHELVHIRQSREGRNLFPRKPYIEQEIEIEAYRAALREGKRRGLPKAALRDHLDVDWLTREEKEKLARKVGIY